MSSDTYSARNWQRCLIAPGHSDEAGNASPFRRRIVRGDRVKCAANAVRDQRCSMLGMPHSAEVHRFDMHALELLKSNRTAVRAHAVAIALRSPFGVSRAFSSAAVSTLSGADSADVLRVCAALLRSADGAPTASNLSYKDRVPTVGLRFRRASLPGRNMVRPERVSALAHERRDAIGDSQVQQENQRTRNGTRTHHREDARDSDGYDGETARE